MMEGSKRWPPVSESQLLWRIMKKCQVTEGGCWIWQGFISSGGYGKTHFKRKSWPVHRLTYTLAIGPIPPMLDVCHTCDHPPCCNPDHLFVGTRSANIIDCVKKGRNPRAAAEACPRGHKYAEHGYITKSTGRRKCRACHRIRARINTGWPEDKAMYTPVVPHGLIVVPGSARKRGAKPKTHCVNGHPINPENSYVAPGSGIRRCRACRTDGMKRYFERYRGAPSAGVPT